MSQIVFHSLEDVEKYIKTAVQGALQDHVAEEALSYFDENAGVEVYAAYEPFVYQRSYSLQNRDTYDVQSGDMSINISVNHPYGELIEHGDGWNGEHYTYPFNRAGTEEQFLKARPFFSRTVEQLEGGLFKELLKEGLETYGITAK